MTDADRVDGKPGAIAEGDDVAVGRKTPTQSLGPRPSPLSRTARERSGPQRTCRQHDDAPRHAGRAWSAIAGCSILPVEVDAPAAATRPGEVARSGVREDLRAVPDRVGQIG